MIVKVLTALSRYFRPDITKESLNQIIVPIFMHFGAINSHQVLVTSLTKYMDALILKKQLWSEVEDEYENACIGKNDDEIEKAMNIFEGSPRFPKLDEIDSVVALFEIVISKYRFLHPLDKNSNSNPDSKGVYLHSDS